MMSDLRFRPSSVLALVLAVAACGSSPDRTLPALAADGGNPDPDAATSGDDAAVADADHGTGIDAGVPGSVTCYSEFAPTATCTLPIHCCFNNYSAQHAGSCDTLPCISGTIDCDGPEDCASGQRCCAHAIIDSEAGITGYMLACQASACGAAPENEELCHPTSSAAGTCASGSACVSAADHDYDLPRTLYICQ
jgi:hypothetical protein